MTASKTEYEKQVIEAILRDNAVYYSLGLTKQHFQSAQHRRVYEVMADMLERRLEVNIATLMAESQSLSPTVLTAYDPVTAANAEYYAAALKESKRQLDLNAVIKDLLRQSEAGVSTAEIVDSGTSQMLGVNTTAINRLMKSKDLIFPALDKIQAVYERGEKPEGIPTGFADVDKLLDGFRKNELIVLAARTSIGKTAFALNVAYNIAAAGYSVAFFSLEMPSTDLVTRLVSTVSRVGHQAIRTACLSAGEFSRINDAAQKIHNLDLWFDDTPRISFSDFRNKCRMLKTRGIDIVFLDFLTLVKYGDPRTPRWERVGELSAEIKALSNEIGIPVVALSQLNRGSEGQKPSLENIRQSGEIEENADVIMFLHRESRDDPNAELIVAKHRNGPTGEAHLYMDLQYLRFENAVNR